MFSSVTEYAIETYTLKRTRTIESMHGEENVKSYTLLSPLSYNSFIYLAHPNFIRSPFHSNSAFLSLGNGSFVRERHLYFKSMNFARSCFNQSDSRFPQTFYSSAVDIGIVVGWDWNSIMIPVARCSHCSIGRISVSMLTQVGRNCTWMQTGYTLTFVFISILIFLAYARIRSQWVHFNIIRYVYSRIHG